MGDIINLKQKRKTEKAARDLEAHKRKMEEK